jgi:hypothetical protein
MGQKRRKDVPILLNYTGEIIRIILPENDNRFRSQNGTELVLPPLGKPTVEIRQIMEDGALFHTEIHEVHGIPPPMKGVYYIVHDHIAKLLYGIRTDLLVIYNKRAESSKNVLKPEEMMLVGDDFSYFIVTSSTN